MKALYCIALLVVAQVTGFSIRQSERDLSNVQELWSQGSLGAHDAILRHPQGAKGFSNDGRIVNGEEATPHEYPFIVGLFMAGGYFCTGSLIYPQWVLTAAHCQVDEKNFTDVYLGAHNVRLQDEPDRIIVRATENFVHPEYRPNLLINDVALIKLPAPVDIVTDIIETLRVDEINKIPDQYVGRDVQISGWGKTSDASTSISPTLQKGTVRVIANADCAATYGATIRNSSICTSVEPTGTCNGDSGSALFIKDETDGKWTQIGITSFVSSQGCGSGLPDGFANVAYFRDWIDGIIGAN